MTTSHLAPNVEIGRTLPPCSCVDAIGVSQDLMASVANDLGWLEAV